jgi:hypothetical protein
MPVHLDDPTGARLLVKLINVLSDQGFEDAGGLQAGQGVRSWGRKRS